MISSKPETVVLGSKINLEGEEKDLFIKISGVDQPAKIKIGDKVYPATLRQVMVAEHEPSSTSPFRWDLAENPSTDAELKQTFDYFHSYISYLHGRYIKTRKILVVQLNSSGVEFLPISGKTAAERYPDAGEVKIKYPEELPFTGIALDSNKARGICDDDKPFNAIAVDDNLLSVGADVGQGGSCFILELVKVLF